MSSLTHAVIYGYYIMEETERLIKTPLEFDAERDQRFEKIDMDAAGGTKYFCVDIYGAAFNYVNKYDIMEWFKKLEWNEGDSAVLVIAYEDDDTPSVIRISGGKVDGEL